MSPHPRSNPVALLTLLFWLPALEAEEAAAAATDARPNLYVTRLEAALPDRPENQVYEKTRQRDLQALANNPYFRQQPGLVGCAVDDGARPRRHRSRARPE